MTNIYSSIIKPHQTEKAANMQASGQYTFIIPRQGVTKVDVKNAVREIYGVEVDKVKVMILPGKTRYMGRKIVQKRKPFKKAIVTLKDGKTIDPNKFKISSKK